MKLTTLAAAWLAGMALAYGWYDADPLPLLFLAGAAAIAALTCRLLGVAVWPALLVAACLLGLWRYEVWQDAPPPLLVEHGGATHARGRIVSDPEATATRVKFTLELTDIARSNSRGIPDWQAPRFQAAGVRPSPGRVGGGKGVALLPVRGRSGDVRRPATARTP